jgi:hypothetical protein
VESDLSSSRLPNLEILSDKKLAKEEFLVRKFGATKRTEEHPGRKLNRKFLFKKKKISIQITQ